MKAILKTVFLVFLGSMFGYCSFAQINLGKAKEKINLRKKKEEPKKNVSNNSQNTQQANPNSNQNNNATSNNTVVASGAVAEAKQKRASLEKENKYKIEFYEDGKMKEPQEIPGFLTFTNDYEKPTEDKLEFVGKDGKFPNPAQEQKAYQTALAYNMCPGKL